MRIFGTIIAASFVFWLAETGYFGWNMTPQSHAELACDQIVNVIFFSAWLVFCMPSLRFLRAINPFQRVRWFYIEQGADGSETITARRLTRFWRALLLAGVLWCLEKTIRTCGVPSRLSRFVIVRYVVVESAQNSES